MKKYKSLEKIIQSFLPKYASIQTDHVRSFMQALDLNNRLIGIKGVGKQHFCYNISVGILNQKKAFYRSF